MNFSDRIQVTEVGPRDGFQNLKAFIPTEVKQSIIDTMAEVGVKTMEITSFVHPKAIPQMADAARIAAATLEKHPHLKAYALVPNLTGAHNAYTAGVRDVNYVISVSAAHNRANVNRTKEESLEDLKKIGEELPELHIKLSVATAFGCPFEGAVAEKDVFDLMEAALKRGVTEFALCDTIGVANPKQTGLLSKHALQAFPNTVIALHMHNTRGMGLANALAGIDAGLYIFETSVGGLGGCPFAPGAAGNTATEDLLNMAHAMGIKTGIDFEAYLRAVEIVKEKIDENLSSNMARACKYEHVF
ncbi:MAG TPA: hydroxymethylglutaryl-CoA lyase [Anaerovoracaceae bacterium]|nr:hydroxymethylglutaryl-CoA lyase [Anaerovoracaceae bacterium]